MECRLLKNSSHLEAYNTKFQKFIDRGAIRKLTEEELDGYLGPISYVTHLPVYKPDSATTPLRIVTCEEQKVDGLSSKTPKDTPSMLLCLNM